MIVKIMAWNVRGLNNIPNQDQVLQFIRDGNFSICCLLETHVYKGKLNKVGNKMYGQWDWISNNASCDGGTRIMLGWDPNSVKIMLLDQHAQALHCYIEPVNGQKGFHCSFVYGHHRMVPRRQLWKTLKMHKKVVKDAPWLLMGDFNATLDPKEHSAGPSNITTSMSEFLECVSDIEVDDIGWSGLRYTWNQAPGRTDGILKKLDRVMGNAEFMANLPSAHVQFHPFLKSDHTPMVLTLSEIEKAKPKPFKFPNYITSKEEFLPAVTESWMGNVQGYAMFGLVTKLKRLKKVIRKLNYNQGNLFCKVRKLQTELERIQSEVVADPTNKELRFEEMAYVKAFNEAVQDEELFLKQKAKVHWLREGDQNTKYFHKSVKERINKGRIESIEDMDGNRFYGEQVSEQFVAHFKNVLGNSKEVDPINEPDQLFTRKINPASAEYMVRPITDDEIRAALFDIDDEKAPGPDGYSSKFFKSAWSIIGPDMCKAIKEYFTNGKLLKEVNATVIALVPKVQNPNKVSEFRPIACCNVTYKCISKVITNRIKGVLDMIVDENQSAFIPGRQISDNILLTQELMRNYHRKNGNGPAKCAFKIDIQKAYDSVEWSFLRSCLGHFGFHHRMISWIMNCISSPSFTISINGEHKGFFQGLRGIRQGDPMSPYLFTLVMEVFTLIMKRQIDNDDDFQYHWKCNDLQLTHLCFADDLLVFCHGDRKSALVVRKALDEFSRISGLIASMEKSSTFFYNVKRRVKDEISEVMPFSVGELPVRYLGVPLLSSKLRRNDCISLLNKVKKKLLDWKNKSLSFAGRMQLISSVLCSLHVYWASMFIIPKNITDDIERLIRGFLWCQGDFKRGKAKVNWNDVCKPKRQGGLGFKDLHMWNIALMSKHIWNIVDNKNSIWVKWIKHERLKLRNFWDYNIPNEACWSWRKILQCRKAIGSFIVYRLGNGKNSSAWYDNWHPAGPLGKIISYRDIYEADLEKNARVSDIVVNGEWVVPDEWRTKFNVVFDVPPPVLIQNRNDRVMWRNGRLKTVSFSVKTVWDDISVKNDEVKWANLVWYSQCIPRHAFILWVAIHCKLKTQDKFMMGDDNCNLVCPFCKGQRDSHPHLFFECNYPMAVWNELKSMARIDYAPITWMEIIDYLQDRPINRSIWSIIQRLILGACVYFIWQERNMRLYQNKSRPKDKLIDQIKNIVRLKLMGLKIKNSKQSLEAAEMWDLPLKKHVNDKRYW